MGREVGVKGEGAWCVHVLLGQLSNQDGCTLSVRRFLVPALEGMRVAKWERDSRRERKGKTINIISLTKPEMGGQRCAP